ncbi:class I adenylate-forming enzyme family protein [Bacillus benzoevorans]|uniref:Fatty-acyl-CoA synthase n=1 Tax=Bacillus benzoevorans TaxID=1456 RepID=A0A7X0HV34_9BACI|nr:class I adenylate-forming enzyme family protein [Bacillus benzoevorans]MBB6446210.1 fatty-acyl-CoA synthase [Bacillus benzoevorans]
MESIEIRRKRFERISKDWNPEPVHEFFLKQAEKHSENVYIIGEEQSWTYSETRNLSIKLAASLLELGVKKEDHITLIFPNYPEFIFSKLGSALAGCVTVPLNYRLKKEELSYLISQSDSSYIITLDRWNHFDYISILKELCPEVFEGKKSSRFPNLKKIIVFSPEGKKYKGTADFYELIHSITDDQANEFLIRYQKNRNDHVSDVTDIMYTSGTTSLPKGVLVTHDMIWRSALGTSISRGYQESRRIFVPIPFYHCFGYIVGIAAVSMVGGSVIIQRDFEEFEALSIIEKHRVEDILCVPTIALRLLNAYRAKEFDISSLKSMYCAGSEVPAHIWKSLKEEMGIDELNTGYGMTEIAAGVLQTDPTDELRYLNQYVGRPIPGGHVGLKELNGKNIEFGVIDIDTSETLPMGKEGELICRGPMVTKGYYNKPEETAITIDNAGWLRTGDLGVIDENGYISLTGRIKEIYRIGAENVAPKEIEDIITSHPKVNQAYVVGVPCPIMGEVGMAWVILEQGATATVEEMLVYVSDKLARFKIPKYIRFVTQEELPVTATGKIQKFRLREWYLNEKETVKSVF